MIKEKVLKYSIIAFLIIYALFSIGVCITPLKYNHSLKIALLYALILLIMLLIIKFKIKIQNKILTKRIKKIIFIACVCIGIILRVGLIFLNYNELLGVGDYQTFLHNATTYCETNTIAQKTYVELFPFLIPYMVILGSFFKIAEISYISIVLLNVILDVFTIICLYFIFKNKDISKCVTGIWLLSPINLVWCMICCPVVLVNFGIALSTLIFMILLRNIETKKFIIYSLLAGIIIGIANAFRPIMIILIIAIALYYIYMILKENKFIKNYIISFFIILISFFTVKTLTMNVLDNIIDGNVSRTSGWTLYIGSNVESNGMWYPEPKLDELLGEGLTAEETQQEFKKLAIERYKNNGISNIKLFGAKFFVITGQIAEYTYGTAINALKIESNFILIIVKIALYGYSIFLVFLNLLISIGNLKNKKLKKEEIFYMLFYIGIVMAHLFVEVSPRYYMPAIVPLSIISGISLFRIFNNDPMEEEV